MEPPAWGAGLAKLLLGRDMAPGVPPVKPRCGDALRLKNLVWAKLRLGMVEDRAAWWLALMLSLVGSTGSLPEIARACRNSCRLTD